MFLPTMVLTLAGGAIFGPVMGTVFNLMGATSGAAVSFLITRHLLYDWCTTRRGPRLNNLIRGVEKKGWLFVAVLRLFPIIPFNLVNYGLGITNISFRLYLVITFVFLIPSEIIYTYCGYAGVSALSQPQHLYRDVSLLLGAVIVLVILVNLLNKKLSRKKP